MTNKKNLTNKMDEENVSEISEVEKAQKIQGLYEMISSAEKTIQSAKAMLLALEGKKKSGRKRKFRDDADGNIVQGTFDGQVMIGVDGKQYPVPANYASKSKLIEGDLLKLTITPDGSFIYKQIGPAERSHLIGIVSQDERGNYYVLSEGKPYRVLLASVTYFKVEPGDEVAIIVPRNTESTWAAIDNVLQKGKEKIVSFPIDRNKEKFNINDEIEKWKESLKENHPVSTVIDEWSTDANDIEKEIKKE